MRGSVVVCLTVTLVLLFVKQNGTYMLKVFHDIAQLWVKKKKCNLSIF